MTTKTPFIVHCGECNHEWPAFYSPMPIFEAAELAGNMRCPKCDEPSSEIYFGPAPVDEINTSSERVKETGES